MQDTAVTGGAGLHSGRGSELHDIGADRELRDSGRLSSIRSDGGERDGRLRQAPQIVGNRLSLRYRQRTSLVAHGVVGADAAGRDRGKRGKRLRLWRARKRWGAHRRVARQLRTMADRARHRPGRRAVVHDLCARRPLLALRILARCGADRESGNADRGQCRRQTASRRVGWTKERSPVPTLLGPTAWASRRPPQANPERLRKRNAHPTIPQFHQ